MSLVRKSERLRPHGQIGAAAASARPSDTASPSDAVRPTIGTRTAGMKPDRKTDRRTFLKQGAIAGGLLAGAGAVLAGCGASSDGAQTQSSATHRRPTGTARRADAPRPYGGRTSS